MVIFTLLSRFLVVFILVLSRNVYCNKKANKIMLSKREEKEKWWRNLDGGHDEGDHV